MAEALGGAHGRCSSRALLTFRSQKDWPGRGSLNFFPLELCRTGQRMPRLGQWIWTLWRMSVSDMVTMNTGLQDRRRG